MFLSRSRTLSRLNEEVRRRLDNMMQNNLAIMTGDANGADRAMQAYLASHHCSDVTIYFVGEQPRNNVGSWKTKHVVGTKGLSGRDFYAQKDHAVVVYVAPEKKFFNLRTQEEPLISYRAGLTKYRMILDAR